MGIWPFTHVGREKEGRSREHGTVHDTCYGERYGRKRNAIWQSNAGNGPGNNHVTLTTLYNGVQREGNRF